MLQHIVLFRFAEPLGLEEADEMRAHIQSWATEMPFIRGLRFGTSTSALHREDGYQYLLYIEFDDDAALAQFMAHPAHQKLGGWIAGRAQYLIFDYPLNDQTLIVPSVP